VVYIDPEMLKSVDITRGPTATIFGSGAIGGVVAFSLLDADDILRAGETAAIRIRNRYSSNGVGFLTSETGAVKVGNFDILGQINWRSSGNYVDGSGTEVKDTGSDTGSSLVKARWRPAPGHQITGTIIDYHSDFINTVGTARRDTDVQNEQYTLGYTFARPDVVGGRLHLVAEQDRVPSSFFGAGGGSTGALATADAYTLVDLFGQYTFNDNAVLNVNIDNLFDVNYRPYLYQQNNPGLAARVGLTLRFGNTPGATTQ
jgi:outer membrane receptor protein involved in Fe transport